MIVTKFLLLFILAGSEGLTFAGHPKPFDTLQACQDEAAKSEPRFVLGSQCIAVDVTT